MLPEDAEHRKVACSLGHLWIKPWGSLPSMSSLLASLTTGMCSSHKFMSTGVGSEICIRSAFTKNVFFSSKAGATVQCIIVGFLDVS